MPNNFIYEIDVQSNDVKTLNYVKALARYNQKVEIVNIIEDDSYREKDYLEDKTGKDIPALVDDAKSRGVKKITFECTRSNSLFAIFPPITISNGYLKTEAKDKILSRFHTLEYNMATLGEPSALDAISKEEALNLFALQTFTDGLSGALHLEEFNSIVFENRGSCYLLVYGNETSLQRVKDISFHVEGGFMFQYASQYAHVGEFYSGLHKCFTQWQENNYQNDLFPNTMSVNPIGGSSEKKIIQEGRNSLFFSSTPSSSSPPTISVEKMQNEPVKDCVKFSAPLPSLQLTHDMVIAAGKQKEMSAKVKVVKDILFQTIWLDEIVKKFSYRTSSMNYFVSYDRYNSNYDFISFIAKLVDDIRKIGPVKLESISVSHDKTLFQIRDSAREAIDKADLILCIRSMNTVAGKIANACLESEDEAVVEKNVKVIPITLDSQSNKCLPKRLQQIPHLPLEPSDAGAYSKFFSELLYKMNLLDDGNKLAFDKASEELRKRIDVQYPDEGIAKLIEANDKESENDLRRILGL